MSCASEVSRQSTDRQTGKMTGHAERQKDRQTEQWTGGQADRQKGIQTEGRGHRLKVSGTFSPEHTLVGFGS